MINKKSFLLFSSLTILPLITSIPLLNVSCSKTIDETKKDEDENFDKNPNDDSNNSITPETKPENPEIDIQLDGLLKKINWIEGYRNITHLFHENKNDFFLELAELVFENEDYKIDYSGNQNLKKYFSLYDKKINKYYICEINAEFEKMNKYFSKPKIKDFISKKMIEDYNKNMINEIKISDNDFYISMDKSDNSLTFEKNEIIDFKSSWGVSNNQKRTSIFNVCISKNKIRQTLFGTLEKEYSNFYIENIELTDLYIKPNMIVISNPINYFEFNINNIRNSKDDKMLELSSDEKNKINLDIPGKNNTKTKYWKGTILDKTISGNIIDTPFVDGVASLIPSRILVDESNIGKTKQSITGLDKDKIINFNDDIFNKGKRIKIGISSKNVDDFEKFNLNVNTSIKVGANAGNIFGDWTSAALYDVSAIQKMNLVIKEYKKF